MSSLTTDQLTPTEPVPTAGLAKPLAETVMLNETACGRGILKIVDEFEKNDEFVRRRQLMKWRKHILYWNSVQYLWESTTAKDWLTVDDIKDDPQSDIDPAMYAKIINVYKATGEVYIGALTSSTPNVRFFPKDADDEEDVTSAKAFSRISELIQRHNKAQMLLMKAVFILYNQGLVACYNENKTDTRFGQVEIPEFTDTLVMDRENYCPSCGMTQGQESWQPDIDSMQSQVPPPMVSSCQNCGYQGQMESEDAPRMTQEMTGTTTKNKNREVLEVYGPLNVKIPMWARDQASVPILILETEESIYLMREIYPEYADKIQGFAAPDNWERSARVPTNYMGDFPRDLCTVKRVWLRPTQYRYYMEEAEEFIALKRYPDGLYAVIINGDLLCEIVPDKLDDHWTLTEHPLAESLHAEPIGTPMVPLQDITNELGNLTLETIEFGIGEVFADTRVLDFEAYKQQEARPGQISPATAPTGMALGNGFYEVRPATLSKEVELFADRMTTTTQYVMGTYPSVYGGTLAEGSGTAREYEMSKSSALQRLSTVWLILQNWWADVMGKAVRSFAKNMIADESFVKPQGSNFLNVWIRKIELSGDVGDVLPEVSEALPVSWTQKRDVIMNLMQMKDPAVAAVLTHPENASMVASLLGVPELYIPGDDDRNQQLMEIALLITSEPQMGPMGPISSVPVTPELDNHTIAAEVCRAWLKSEVGQDAKVNNTAGYTNVLAHLKEHLMAGAPPPPMPIGDGKQNPIPDKPDLAPPDHIGDVQPIQ